jgi:hypothetical protein
MQRRRTEMPGVYVPGTWKTTDMMERAAKYVAEDCPLRVLADPCATLSGNDLHRQEHHGSNPLSSTRKSARTEVRELETMASHRDAPAFEAEIGE